MEELGFFDMQTWETDICKEVQIKVLIQKL